MTAVKICGLTRAQDIDAVNQYKPDYAGFVFAPGRRQLLMNTAKELIQMLTSTIVPVGIFVNTPVQVVANIARTCALGAVQLHGAEDNQFIAGLRRLLPSSTIIIKAVRVRDAASVAQVEDIDCDLLLMDACVDGQAGGSGRSFDWALLNDFKRPYLLAGGLKIENVAHAIEQLNPYGVDVSTGVESEGSKDPDKIKKFIDLVKGGVQ